MLYIPCTHCGYNNAVKSETTLFCEKCSKKLMNNFIDWHKVHPDKTFNDFSKIHCISEFDIEARQKPAKKNNTIKIVAIVLISIFVFLAIIGTVGFYFGKKFLDANLSTTTSASVLSGNWKRTAIGSSGLEIELPFALDKQPINLSDTVAGMINTVESFAHMSDKGFKVITFFSVYKEGIEANLDGAVQGCVAQVQQLQGISDFSWNRTDTIVGNKNAAIVNLQYKLLVYPIRIKAMIVCDGNHLWQLITQYSDDDESGKKASEKILASVEIKED